MGIYPLIYIISSAGETNDCCSGSALFSPGHHLSIYTLIALCMIAYFYSSWKKRIDSPVIEVMTNCLLLTGIVLNIFISIQMREVWFWLAGNVPIIILFIFALMKNHQLALASIGEERLDENNADENNADENNLDEKNLDEKNGEEGSLGDARDIGTPETGRLRRFCEDLLRLRLIYKIPILLILCLPLLVVLAGILLLFGQKPDSMIRAFTDTYKQGLSQLDYQCEGVVCGGHFLCTIAARGHAPLVRPVRPGIRGGKKIVCNRQLLVSNAFEELLEKKWPSLHRPVRRLYNRIGRQIHRHYGWFDNKWVSDTVYILMKPLEWFFLLLLYTFDSRPENRIAQQYMRAEDRKKLAKPARS
jgi:hypothetical protein